MQNARLHIITSLALVLVLALAACSDSATEAPAATTAPTVEPTTAPTDMPTDTPTDVPEDTPVEPTADSSEEEATESAPTEDATEAVMVEEVLSNGRILAWVAPGTTPGNHTASGELVYFDADGTMESILTLPDGVADVTPCGPQATSPDGHLFAMMTIMPPGGQDGATLYMVRDSAEPIAVATGLNPISCTGSSSFAFSPDSEQYAYIDWPSDANNADSPHGKLMIVDSTTNESMADFENATDFTFTENGAAYVSFFTNEDGQADEAAIFVWDGENQREVSTITAEEDCYYSSAALAEISTTRLALLLGNRCAETQTQLYLIDIEGGSTQLELALDPTGRYFGFTETNSIWVSPEKDTFWFTLPDGVSNQSAALYASPADAIAETIVIDELAIMPSISDVPYDATNATAFTSDDGMYMAVVGTDRNSNASLYVVNLTNANLAPMRVSAGDQGDTIATMFFNADNTLLYFVAGAHSGENNSLFVLDLTTGNASRVTRGRFAQGVISPDGTLAALMQWIEFDEEEDPYLSLEIVTLENGNSEMIYEGGEVVDGEATNQSFAYPLSWRSE